TTAGGAGGALRGLFAGGTLCDEAMAIAAEVLGPVRSNIPLEPDWALPDDLVAPGHVMIDFGDDELTRGRAHPMIDQRTRLDRLARDAADPGTGVLLLDVVLGHGAHPDPASELVPAIAQARAVRAPEHGSLAVVVSLCGSAGDPQERDRQAEALQGAGAHVHLSNAAATRAAVALVGGGR
ncbi:MAG: FdrA family protein, partial [Actinomycetota bacterium]|nr:FdrA family protein [Actinomycetota bacterium]